MKRLDQEFFSRYMGDHEILENTAKLLEISRNELLTNIPLDERLCFMAVNPTKSFGEPFVTGIVKPPAFNNTLPLEMAGMDFVKATQMVPLLIIHISQGRTIFREPDAPTPTLPFDQYDDNHECIIINAGSVDGRAAAGMIVFDRMDGGKVQIIADEDIRPSNVIKLYPSFEELKEHCKDVRGIYNSYITAFYNGVNRGAWEQFRDDRFFTE